MAEILRRTLGSDLHEPLPGSPKPPRIDAKLERLFEKADSAEAEGLEDTPRRFRLAAAGALERYESFRPVNPDEQVLQAEYGDMALRGYLGAGDTEEAVDLAERLAKSAPSAHYFERVTKRLQLADPSLLNELLRRREAVRRSFEDFHLTLHSKPVK